MQSFELKPFFFSTKLQIKWKALAEMESNRTELKSWEYKTKTTPFSPDIRSQTCTVKSIFSEA